MDDNDASIIEMIKEKKAILLLNKTDLEPKITVKELKEKTDQPMIPISLKENKGLEELQERVKELFFRGELKLHDGIYITNDRHREAFHSALESLRMVVASIEAGMAEDFYSIDLMSAYEVLGRIIGENVEEDLVNMIFKEFCMGK